ncbi:Transcription elongation factor Spt4 [uncultured archaeon]|nr:Transcription elongation factor Spt4 [uncultured archaeon]
MKACKNCRLILEDASVHQCPNCQGTELTEKYSGQLIVVDPAKSLIGQKLDIKVPGRYAIKIRER